MKNKVNKPPLRTQKCKFQLLIFPEPCERVSRILKPFNVCLSNSNTLKLQLLVALNPLLPSLPYMKRLAKISILILRISLLEISPSY